MPETVGLRLVAAIAAQDAAAIADCFSHEAEFRALTPYGVRERKGADETAALIAAWYSDSTVIDLVDARTDEVGGRLHLTYRFEGIEDGQPYVVQQHLFCTLDAGKIAAANLLCSGFLARVYEDGS
jgi:ketosteroid isomerase-like protein